MADDDKPAHFPRLPSNTGEVLAGKPSLRPFKKHILMCTGPRCAPEKSLEVYQYLKEQLKRLGYYEGPERIVRSQCHCFGICQKGPLAAVYPDNVWYCHLTKEKVDRVIQEHLLGNKPVEDYVFYKS